VKDVGGCRAYCARGLSDGGDVGSDVECEVEAESVGGVAEVPVVHLHFKLERTRSGREGHSCARRCCVYCKQGVP